MKKMMKKGEKIGNNGDGFIDRSILRILLRENDSFTLLYKCSYQVLGKVRISCYVWGNRRNFQLSTTVHSEEQKALSGYLDQSSPFEAIGTSRLMKMGSWFSPIFFSI